MFRTFTLMTAAAALALSLAGASQAAPCRDAKGHFVKCPPAATQSAPANAPAANAPAHSRNANKGKPCGNSCIAMDKVCHK